MTITKEILIVVAHPDDEVLGCAGSIARYAAEGKNVRVIFLSDGVRSRYVNSRDNCFQSELKTRISSAEYAAEILGIKSIFFANFKDNQMDEGCLLDKVRFIEEKISIFNPEIVLTHHACDLNIDHRITHEAVVTASRPHPNQSVKQLLFFEVPSSTEWHFSGAIHHVFSPNWFVNISQYCEIKYRALRAYEAELREWPHSRSERAIEHLMRWRGAMVGVEAAEAFILGRNLCL